MAVPPEDPKSAGQGTDGRRWHLRYWSAANRPFPGCGCLATLVLFVFLWWLAGLLFPGIFIW